ncbi:MAG: hypothetical protein FWD17_00705 [Polyangiaceae bacterium]|nr:hypothetical protein [Polyangiaceae bacterium]
MKPRQVAEGAALVFLAQAVFAVVHLASGSKYWGVTHVFSLLIDVKLALIWLASAAAMMIRRSFPLFFVSMAGAAASLMFGLFFSILERGRGYGVPFLLAGVLLAFLLKRSVPAWDAPASAPAETRYRGWPWHWRPRQA